MPFEKERGYFKTKGIDGRIQEFEISSAAIPFAAKIRRIFWFYKMD